MSLFVELILCLTVVLLPLSSAQAETASNARSPLGINLNGVTYYTAEQPFLNIFKTSGVSQSNPRGWTTGSTSAYDTQEEAYLQLDENGYPTTLTASSADPNKPQLFNHVSVILLALGASDGGKGPPFQAGNYVVLYDGQGTITYTDGAKLVSSSPGRDIVQLTAAVGSGLGINITSTDPNHNGNYIRNIRVVYAPYESLLNAGTVFRPDFVSSLKAFHVLRFMDWLDTNNSTVTTWESRSHVADAGWGAKGVPLEICIQLANAVGADPWVNVPAQATDDYIRQMATLVHNMLGGDQKVYVEYSNEVWNSMFSQSTFARTEALAISPGTFSTSDYRYVLNWSGIRTAQMCDIWKSVWGNDYSRVHCVLGAQAANAWTATQELDCSLWVGPGNAPCWKHNITDVAIAPYFSFQAPSSWAGLDQATQLNDLFTELMQGGLIQGDYPGGYLKQVSDLEAAYRKALAPYGLPFIAYEGGQGFAALPTYGNGSWAMKLYVAANRDPRMAAAYAKALSDWKANGGELYNQFVDVSAPAVYGEWGALESYLDPVTPLASAPPKWQALQNFISSNPCWWANCAGTVEGVPDAPDNFSKN